MTNHPIEKIVPQFYNDAAELLPVVYRFNQSGLRYYFTIKDGTVKFYPSVTTVIEKTTPTSYGIKKLIGELGLSEFYKMMNTKAHFGTLLHKCIADYLIYKYFDFDNSWVTVLNYFKEKNINYDDAMISEWNWNLKKDMSSLIQFCIDYEVKPIVIEGTGTYQSVFSPECYFAGTCDLICELTIKEKGFFGELYKSGEKKGQPKESYRTRRVNALIDFKSGKSGFFEDHEIQLHMYNLIALFHFNIHCEKLFNVAPADWVETPTYKVKDQTDSPEKDQINYLLKLFSQKWQEPKDILLIDGMAKNGNLSEVCRWVPASEYVLAKLRETA